MTAGSARSSGLRPCSARLDSARRDRGGGSRTDGGGPGAWGGKENLWGRHAEGEKRILAHVKLSPEDEDLLDRAAVETLVHGGKVAVVSKKALPHGPSSGAVLAAVMGC